MPSQDDFPKSVVLHFPPSVYQKHGAAEMIPKLLEILCVEDLRCVQFLRNGKVRVSFREKDMRDHYLVEGLRFGDLDIPVTKDGQKVTVLHIRDLPYEVASDDLVEFFSNYGEVLTVERSVAANFPALCNGNRILKLILNEDLPYFLSVCGFQCRVWYRGQPLQCLVCRQRGHRAQSSPLSSRCRYCHQVGHMARDCAQAWDPPPVVSVDPDVDVSSASSSATVVEDPPDKSSAPVCVPEIVNNSSDPEPPSVSPVDNLPDPEPLKDKPPVLPTKPDDLPDKPPVSLTTPMDQPLDPEPVKVTDKPPDDDVPMPKPARLAVTAKVFCVRLSKTFNHVSFPNFSETGEEWDSKAKAHLRGEVKAAFSCKEINLTNRDPRKWSDKDLRDVSNLLCEMLSVRDNLVDFVFGLVKSYWNTAKKSKTSQRMS